MWATVKASDGIPSVVPVYPASWGREAADEIEKLQEAGDWLWEAMSRHDNTRECPQCQDMIRLWKEVRNAPNS